MGKPVAQVHDHKNEKAHVLEGDAQHNPASQKGCLLHRRADIAITCAASHKNSCIHCTEKQPPVLTSKQSSRVQHQQQFAPGYQGMPSARTHSMQVTNNSKPLCACIAGSMADIPSECTARDSTAPLARHSSPQRHALRRRWQSPRAWSRAWH